MKTIGLIGGMSWHSTALYYELINREVAARLGGLHSARICLYSVDLADVIRRQESDDWELLAAEIGRIARQLEVAGADCLILCSNTIHRVAGSVQDVIDIPLIHIADVTASAARDMSVGTVGLLGTRWTMEGHVYRSRIEAQGVGVVVPESDLRSALHGALVDEVCRGRALDGPKQVLADAIESVRRAGARAIVLGCTELSLLIDGQTSDTPLLDTTVLHARAGVDFALAPGR